MAALKYILSSWVSKGMGHTIATIFLPRSYCQAHTFSGYPAVGFCRSTGRCTGASSTIDIVAFLERKVPDFIPQTLWPPNSPDLNPVNYSIWSVLQEKSLPIKNS